MNLLERTCHEFGITEKELLGDRKYRSYTYPRFAVAVILRDFCGLGYAEIANVLKRKDHTTIIHAVKTGRKLIDQQHLFREKLYTIAGESGIKPKRVILKNVSSFYDVGHYGKEKNKKEG